MTKKTHDVTLSKAVEVDGKEVLGIDLRKPKSGELRGLKLTDVLQMDVDAMLKLLPRITQPPLSPAQVADLELEDLTALSGKAVLFFAKKADLAAMENS